MILFKVFLKERKAAHEADIVDAMPQIWPQNSFDIKSSSAETSLDCIKTPRNDNVVPAAMDRQDRHLYDARTRQVFSATKQA